MQRYRVKDGALRGIHRDECAGRWVHVAGTQVIEAGVGVVLLTVVEITVFRRSGFGEEVSESIVRVGVGYRSRSIGQKTDRAVGILLVFGHYSVCCFGGADSPLVVLVLFILAQARRCNFPVQIEE